MIGCSSPSWTNISSRRWFRRCCRRSTWRLLRFACMLCSYDPYAYVAGKREVGRLFRGTHWKCARRNRLIDKQGGYNLKSISKSALAVTKTLMGEPPDRIEETAPSKIAVHTVRQVIEQQSRYWRCLYPRSTMTGSRHFSILHWCKYWLSAKTRGTLIAQRGCMVRMSRS